MWPSIRPHDAYLIQHACVNAWTTNGRSVVGYKVLVTRPDLMRRWHTRQPAYGHLLDDAVLKNNSTIESATVVRAKAEPEVAIVLARDLNERDCSRFDVAAAVAYVAAAIEVPTGHMDWKSRVPNVVADNGGAGYAIVSDSRCEVTGHTLAGREVWLSKNGSEVSRGSTSEVLGDPLEAVAWLARTLRAKGDSLRAGQTIMTGSCSPSVAVGPGDVVAANVDGLGMAQTRFE